MNWSYGILLIPLIVGIAPRILNSSNQIDANLEKVSGNRIGLEITQIQKESKILEGFLIAIVQPDLNTAITPVVSPTPEVTNHRLSTRGINPSELSKTNRTLSLVRVKPYWLLGLVLFLWIGLAVWFVISQLILN